MMARPEETVKEVLGRIVEKQFPRESTVTIKAINSSGANYTSALFEATVTTPEGTVELFAKVAVISAKLSARELFEIEKNVYLKLAKVYESFQDSYLTFEEKYVFPKYYGCNEADGPQTIVTENLLARGYEAFDRFSYIDWEYAAKSVEMLARFHALSLAFQKERPEEFLETVKLLKFPPMCDGSQWAGLLDGALAAVEDEDRERVARCLEGSVSWSKLTELCAPRKTSVIIHGDYRPSNLMHKKLDDGSLHVIPVDYQTARLGCPAADLVYFLVMGSDQPFRQQYFQQIVEHYYDELSLALKRLGFLAEDVYEREEFESDLKEKLPFGICVAAIALPFVTASAAHAPAFARGSLVPRANELFAERFRALVRDFKQWGII